MTSAIEQIVVGVDGSTAGAAALAWAALVATSAKSELLAITALENPWSEVPPEALEQLLEQRRKHLTDEWITPAINTGATVRPIVLHGDPRRVVLDRAQAEKADLVVLGRTGNIGGPGFLHLGSVVEHAAHHIQRPLAVIPSTSTAIERVLVGIDGSADSLHALAWSGELARLFGATVVAVAVQEPFPKGIPSPDPQNPYRAVEHDLDRWTAPIAERGIRVDHVTQTGLHPADGLLHVAAERNGDVLVVGARGTGGFSGLRVGGVAIKVLHRATLPVVLVPATSE